MSDADKQPPITFVATIFVVLVILGAAAVAGSAIRENMRFVNATSQILSLIDKVRSMAAAQKTFAQIPGENLWDSLVRMSQISEDAPRINAWGGQIRATVAAVNALRVETDLPSRGCRRLALYFMGRQSADIGLYQIDALSDQGTAWTQIYPIAARNGVEGACGEGPVAHLGLVFRIR